MRNKFFYKTGLLLLSIIVFCALNSFILMPKITGLREKKGMSRNSPLYNAPPQFVIAVNLLGGLRCILIDMLWLRTMRLREEGKFFEMAQLHKWICALEPQLEEIWGHSAWNLAYNISYEMQTPQDRWRWIKKAIELLRDDGLKYNSRSAIIRREIAWIFLHKIGQQWDDCHSYYKQQLAMEMSRLIKSGDDVRYMASLPDIKTAVFKNPGVKETWLHLNKNGVKTLSGFEKFFSENQLGEGKFDRRSLEYIYSILRADELKSKYKLSIDTMVALMDKFGEFDWRLPDAHAVYWASEGRKFAPEKHYIYYDRIIYIAMQSMYRRGKLIAVKDKDATLYITEPDSRFVAPMYKLYQEMFATYKNEKGALGNIKSSYYYFLKEVIVLLYTFNQEKESKKYFDILLSEFSDKIKHKNFLEFILNEFSQTAKTGSYDSVKGLVFGLVRQAYWNLALGNDDKYTGYLNLSRMLINSYTKQSGNQDRLRIPALNIIQEQVVEEALKNGFPEALRESLKKRIAVSK